MVLHSDRTNQTIVLLKPGGAHPFVERVDWITRSHGQISETCGQREQDAQDEFEQEADHSALRKTG